MAAKKNRNSRIAGVCDASRHAIGLACATCTPLAAVLPTRMDFIVSDHLRCTDESRPVYTMKSVATVTTSSGTMSGGAAPCATSESRAVLASAAACDLVSAACTKYVKYSRMPTPIRKDSDQLCLGALHNAHCFEASA